MKNFAGLIFAFSLVSLATIAQDSTPSSPAAVKIGTADAAKYYDQEMIVTGRVAQVTLHEKVVFLNLDKPYPNTPFAGVIFSNATNKFGDLPGLKDKDVELQGRIVKFRGSPEIILSNATQLTLAGKQTGTK